jgi:hypothetical protein
MKVNMSIQTLLSAFSSFLRTILGSSSQVLGEVTGGIPDPVQRKVSLIIFNPSIPSAGNKKLVDVMKWNDPDNLAAAYINDLKEVSLNYVNFTIAERIVADLIPIKEDKFSYDPDEYYQAIRSGTGFHEPDGVDYYSILKNYDLINKVNNGTVDEVWLFGFPYSGFYESRMVGPESFWCNAPPILDLPECVRRFVVMGFNYQRGNGEMLESLGHRAEYIMQKVFSTLPTAKNLWERFIRYEKITPGKSEVGSVHFAPNSQYDYDWGNPTVVPCYCDNWYQFPNLSGVPKNVNCTEWGNGDIRQHHLWWLRHFPHITGSADSISYNWWKYIIDPNLIG